MLFKVLLSGRVWVADGTMTCSVDLLDGKLTKVEGSVLLELCELRRTLLLLLLSLGRVVLFSCYSIVRKEIGTHNLRGCWNDTCWCRYYTHFLYFSRFLDFFPFVSLQRQGFPKYLFLRRGCETHRLSGWDCATNEECNQFLFHNAFQRLAFPVTTTVTATIRIRLLQVVTRWRHQNLRLWCFPLILFLNLTSFSPLWRTYLKLFLTGISPRHVITRSVLIPFKHGCTTANHSLALSFL